MNDHLHYTLHMNTCLLVNVVYLHVSHICICIAILECAHTPEYIYVYIYVYIYDIYMCVIFRVIVLRVISARVRYFASQFARVCKGAYCRI